MKHKVLWGAGAVVAVLAPRVALAGDFDETGLFAANPNATFFEPFDAPVRYVPEGVDSTCVPEHYTVVTDAQDALEGTAYVHVDSANCGEHFLLTVPAEQGSYKTTLWMRHGSTSARVTVEYPAETGLQGISARFAPTGRTTSDGWIELAANAIPIDGTASPTVYLRFVDFADDAGVDLDALELTRDGEFRETPACDGVGDPICGEDAVCIGGLCRLGDPSVPPMPDPALKDEFVDALEFKLRNFFGARKSRLVDLPVALTTIAAMRDADTPWKFWNGFAIAIHQLHDWHTAVRGNISSADGRGRLNACFIEGDADLTQATWPKHPVYADILVSHVGAADNAGLLPGDRLVAVDGQHPIEWARSLIETNWDYHIACDPTSFADFPEAMNGLITRYAREFTVIRCDGAAGTCANQVETIKVADLTSDGGGSTVSCDNRPTYHLGANSPSSQTHRVGSNFFQGPVDNTTPEEAIYGMVWDTLYGGGDPNSTVNSTIRNAVTNWKATARGVILDHRAGNGGTLDTPQYMTELVRPKEVIAVTLMPIQIAADDGPTTPEEGLLRFNREKTITPYTVGSPSYDPDLPVAFIIHRDGSASDYLPYGMKGANKVKLFGPGPTAGAFSTFAQFSYWGGLSFQFASGDTISSAGVPLLGAGVTPDVLVEQRQSDLMVGIDTIHEAALAWVRQELKP
ncbi:MAG: S41 family peptidase [Polyangiaceae bacterium]